MLKADFIHKVEEAVGLKGCGRGQEALELYSADASRCEGRAELVVFPDTTEQISTVAALCNHHRVPLTVRGAGTGYTGGSVPSQGGILLAMERFSRIIEIDQVNLLAIVEPNVVTGELQKVVESIGLFYPPDPASLNRCAIGGNIAECAGGPRAFKYGTTKRYVLGLEAVLATGEVIHTGGKTVKNVVGYDLTQTLIGSEGTLAIVTKAILRLIPLPPCRETVQATFRHVDDAVRAMIELVKARVIPSALELIDLESLEAVARYLDDRTLAPAGTAAMLLLEVDGLPETVREEAARVEDACRRVGAETVRRAADVETRDELWRVRRELSPALKVIAGLKLNHDVVVPKSKVPDLFKVVEQLRINFDLTIACFGHVGDGNIHVNIMVDPNDLQAVSRAADAELQLFKEVIRLEGVISGEHGIGLSKRPFMKLGLSSDELALMSRLKRAFDPNGILNPGKIFPDCSQDDSESSG